MRLISGLLFSLLLGPQQAFSATTQHWRRVADGLGERAFCAITTHPTIPTQLLAASRHTVYQSLDGGNSWKERFEVPTALSIRRIAISRSTPVAILVVTDGGLFGSFDGGTTWPRILRGIGEGHIDCTHVAFDPLQEGVALLGTRNGLLKSTDGGRHWTTVLLPALAKHVAHFAFDPQITDRIFLLSDNRLFAGDLRHGTWRQCVTNLAPGIETEAPDPSNLEPDDEEAAAASSGFTTVAIHPQQPTTIYLAGARGLMRSTDEGKTWQWLTLAGLPSPAISSLLLQVHSPLVIYAGTQRGVSRYETASERWSALGKSMFSARVRDLTASPGAVWAATDDGLYAYETTPDPLAKSDAPSADELLSNFSHEPTIAQVQQAAIRYAEVHPDKIRNWRRQAALKALLPTVDFGVRRARAWDASIDEGTYPKFQVLETQDRDASADVSVKWDLGNLIWNNDQTTIDSRSRLLVQLRDDVLSEVTRTYFERRRMQIALLLDAPTDPKTAVENELRVRELTALIDGLTGGEFSRQMTLYTTNRREDGHGHD